MYHRNGQTNLKGSREDVPPKSDERTVHLANSLFNITVSLGWPCRRPLAHGRVGNSFIYSGLVQLIDIDGLRGHPARTYYPAKRNIQARLGGGERITSGHLKNKPKGMLTYLKRGLQRQAASTLLAQAGVIAWIVGGPYVFQWLFPALAHDPLMTLWIAATPWIAAVALIAILLMLLGLGMLENYPSTEDKTRERTKRGDFR